jgi:hypothetical protein
MHKGLGQKREVYIPRMPQAVQGVLDNFTLRLGIEIPDCIRVALERCNADIKAIISSISSTAKRCQVCVYLYCWTDQARSYFPPKSLEELETSLLFYIRCWPTPSTVLLWTNSSLSLFCLQQISLTVRRVR